MLDAAIQLWARQQPVVVAAVDDDNLGRNTNQLGLLTNAVSFGILVLTMVGAAAMMISMLRKEYTAGKGSTVRSRMVLFLVAGDFFLGLVGVIPTLATLVHHPPQTGTAFCNSMGYLLGVSLYVQHVNTLLLCVSTFLILIHPLSTATRLLERHWRWLFPLPWVFCCTIVGVAYGVSGSWVYNNGLCFYGPGLFSEIWQFIPRGIVFTVISVLYVRLFVFLRRPDKIRSSTSLQGGSQSSTTGQLSEAPTGGRRWSRWRFGSRSSFGFRSSVSGSGQPSRWAGFTGKSGRGSDGSTTRPRVEREESAGGPKDLGMKSLHVAPVTQTTHFGLQSANGTSSTSSANRDLPAWERIELPDYSKAAIFGDSPPLSPKTTKRGSVSGWKWGMGVSKSFGGVENEGLSSTDSGDEPIPSHQPRRSTLAPLKIPLPAAPAQPALRRNPSFINPPAPLSRRPSGQTSEGEGDGRLLDFPFASLRRGSHVSFAEHHTPSTPTTNARTNTPPPTASGSGLPLNLPQTFGGMEPGQSLSSGPQDAPGAAASLAGFSFASQGSVAQAPLLPSQDESTEFSPSTTIRPRFSDAAPDRVAPAGTLTEGATPPPIVLSQDFAETGSNANTSETRRDSVATGSERSGKVVKVVDLTEDRELGPNEDEETDDEEYDLARILELTQPPTDYDYYRSFDGGRNSGARGMGSSGEAGSGSQTGSGSDGKTQESMSKFMNRKASLLMLSFPLAYVLLFVVSLIRIIYDFASPKPIPALSAVSRWLVFSQGLVDALIYGIIEWKVKRTVRRRTRKMQSTSHEDSRGGAITGGSFGGHTNRGSTATGMLNKTRWSQARPAGGSLP